MRAVLIDPFASTITEVDYDGDYKSIYGLISGPNHYGDEIAVDTFDVVGGWGPKGRDDLYVDDNGLFQSGQVFFTLDGYHQPLAGRALVLSHDDEGESIASDLDLDWARARVKFWTDPRRALAHAEASLSVGG